MGVGVAFSELFEVGFAVTTFTPLLQTSFLPDLMQVYLYPLTVETAFSLEHVEPVFTAPKAGEKLIESSRLTNKRRLIAANTCE